MGHTKDILNERRQGPTLAKARGDAGGAERPWEGLTNLGAEQSSAGSFPSAIFSLCFERLTQTGEKGLFSHLESFQNTERIKSKGKHTHSSQIFFSGQNKQTDFLSVSPTRM